MATFLMDERPASESPPVGTTARDWHGPSSTIRTPSQDYPPIHSTTVQPNLCIRTTSPQYPQPNRSPRRARGVYRSSDSPLLAQFGISNYKQTA